jgi:hypothetical protein
MPSNEILHEGLRTFESCGSLGRSISENPSRRKVVDESRTERDLGTHHHQIDLLRTSNLERVPGHAAQVLAPAKRSSSTGIAWHDEHLGNGWRLEQCEGQCVFTPPGTND